MSDLKPNTDGPRVVLRAHNIHKDFHLPHERNDSLKSAIVHVFKKKDKEIDTQHALRGVSFDIHEGEFFGILGRNGSGKSTLLKILSGIYQPTKGMVSRRGKLVPFIELGVGFNPELTGRENVYLNGALLGFSKKEIDARYDEIVEFAELQDFMEQKLKNYSSGMQVRLAFSVATRAEADILIVDEVLAVGDEAFQRKCNDYFFKLKRNKKTVILVTHSMEDVRRFCDRAILIDDGLIQHTGNADKVASAYSAMFMDEHVKKLEENSEVDGSGFELLGSVKIDDVEIFQDGKRTNAIQFKKDFSIGVSLIADDNYEDVTMGLHMINQAGQNVLAMSTKNLKEYSLRKGANRIRFDVENIFTEGAYYLALAVESNVDSKLLIKEAEIAPFSIIGLDRSKYSIYGLTHPEVQVVVEKDS